MNSMWIILWHIICPCQLMSQNNHLPCQIFLSKALHSQTTHQSIPRRLGQGNYKESMWNTKGIPLNRNLLMRKVYIQNQLLLLLILPRLHLWILKWVLQLNNWRKVMLDRITVIAPLPVTEVFTRPHLRLTRLRSKWSTRSFCKQYSIADAWINGNIAKYQQKLSGRDLLISSSCILIWNVPHVLFHTHNNWFQ